MLLCRGRGVQHRARADVILGPESPSEYKILQKLGGARLNRVSKFFGFASPKRRASYVLPRSRGIKEKKKSREAAAGALLLRVPRRKNEAVPSDPWADTGAR